MRSWDVAVVGLGAMGSAAAWQLARRGRRVIAFEQHQPDHALGGSHGRSRIFRLSYEHDDYVRLAVASLDAWRDLEREADVEILVRNGAIDYGSDAVLDRIAGALRRHGLAAELLDSRGAQRRWPGFRFRGNVLFSADGGRTDADVARVALQRRAAAHDAQLRFSTRVRHVLVRDHGVAVVTDDDSVTADVVVVTTNAWTPALLAGAVDLPPITVTQEQPAFFEPLDAGTPWPSFIHYAGDRQRASDFAAYGLPSPAEGGVKVGEHGRGAVVDPDAERPPVDPARLERLADYVREHLPGLDAEPRDPARCLYDMTPDEDFVVDRAGPIVVGAGFSGHGFKFVPVIGRMLADLADGSDHDVDRFRLRR